METPVLNALKTAVSNALRLINVSNVNRTSNYHQIILVSVQKHTRLLMINANALLIPPNFKVLASSAISKTVPFVSKTTSVLNVKRVMWYRVINVAAQLIPQNMTIIVILVVQLKFLIVFYAQKIIIASLAKIHLLK